MESFERLASDPNRFFVKGFRGSSAARLEEAQNRDIIYKVKFSFQNILFCFVVKANKS